MGVKKKSEKLVELIKLNDDQLVQACKNLENNSSVLGFIFAANSSAQVKALKQCLQDINQNAGSQPDTVQVNTVIQVLVAAMMHAHPKNQSRRAISSALQTVNDELHVTIKDAIQTQLLQMLNTAHDTNSFRTAVDNLSSLIDNFDLGTSAVVSLFSEVLSFIVKALDVFYTASREADCDEAASRNMHHCLTTIQICNRLTQKVIQQYRREEDSSHERKRRFEGEVFHHFMNICHVMWNILSRVFLLDCQTACGMGVPLVIKALYGAHCVPEILHLADSVDEELECRRECGRMVTRDLSVSSQLCVFGGILAMFDIQELMIDSKDGRPLMDIIGSNVIQLTCRNNDSNTKLMASRTLLLFTSKTCECLQSGQVFDGLKATLTGQASLLDRIMTYVWNHWQDPVDTIRYQTKLIFQKVIEAHLLATGEDPQTSKFVKHVAESLLALNWQTRGRYEPLCVIVQYTGAQGLLSLSPQLPDELMIAMGEQVLAPYVSQLYEKLFVSHRQELDKTNKSRDPTKSEVLNDLVPKQQEEANPSGKADMSDELSPEASSHLGSGLKQKQDCLKRSDWLRTWVDPVLLTLCRGFRIQQKFVFEYIIPSLLKNYPDTFTYMVEQLSSDTNDHGAHGRSLGVLVTCLSHARRLNVLDSIQGTAATWSSLVGRDKILQALCDDHDQVRLDTFGLLVESRKTTEILKEEDLDLVKVFMTFNLDSQSPAFRQQLIALLKKLILRLRDGGRTLSRTLSTSKKGTDLSSIEAVLTYYKVFLQWLCDHLFEQLHPSASFPRRTTALSLLSVVVQVFGCCENEGDDSSEFHFIDIITPARIQTLIELITDTFEQNKIEAFNILSAIPAAYLHLQDNEKLIALIQSSLELVRSTRPQDCTTAAYLFRLVLKIPDTAAILSEIREKSKPNLSTGALVSGHHQMAWMLLNELEDELLVAEQSLLHAAATRPLYPVLHCLRYLLADINLRNESDSTEWQQIISTIINVCFKVANIVSPVVSNSSPEGNIPAEALHALGPGLLLDAVIPSERDQPLSLSDSAAKVTHMPEYLVVCCWRSIKEVSLLLGELMQRAPLMDSEQSSNGYIKISELHAIGDYFIKQLTESRHRGAFELAYAGFVKMAHMLWRCPLPVGHKLPIQWLNEIVESVSERVPSDKLCATRRSAGVPFYIRALVATEPATRGRQCFKQVMSKLLALAWPQDDQQADVENIPQVHALNILRALFQETALGDDVFPFIAEGLQVALLGYSAKLWSIRNSSTLLFSALITRIFGVKRTKNELSKKNCMTGRMFFHRFPSLHRFLLERLKEATADMGSVSTTSQGAGTMAALHPNLYPVLLVLGRLYPSVIEGADVAYDLKAFIEPVMSCAHSPVYKIRIMAARALCTLIAKGDMRESFVMLLKHLPVNHHGMLHNATHGLLLQVEHLLEPLRELPADKQADLLELVIDRFICCKQLLSSSDPCFLMRTAFLNVIYKITAALYQPLLPSKRTLSPGYVWLNVKDEMLAILLEDLPGNIHVPGAVLFYQSAARYLVETVVTVREELENAESMLLWILSCPLYEVRLQALSVLSRCDRQSTGAGEEHDVDDEDDDDFLNGSIITAAGISQQASDIVQRSHELFKELVTMMMVKESHPVCLVKVLESLCIHKETSSLPWKMDSSIYTAEEILQKVFDSFMTHSRDEVKCAALKLTAFIIPCLYSKKTLETNRLISRWIRLLDEGCCAECSVDMRLAVATTVVNTAPSSLYDAERNSLHLWLIVLRLLHDEDSYVRQQVALVVRHLKSVSVPVDSALYPPVAEKLVLQAMTTAFWGRECLDHLLSCIQRDMEFENLDNDSDIRLFDKGEMNTFRDQIHFVNIIAEHLVTVSADEHVTSSKYLADLYRKLIHIASPRLSLDGSSVQLLMTRLEEVLAELHEVSKELPEMTIKHALINQNVYRDTVVRLWRLRTMLNVIRHLINLDEVQKVRLRQHLSSVRKKFQFECRLTELLLLDDL